jgi:small subunit ribosomal protein S17
MNNTGIRYFSIEEEYQNEISYILKGYEDKKDRKQSLIGYVVSTKCKKSILVRIEHQKYYAKYNKFINVHEKVMAHDDNETGKLNDVITIVVDDDDNDIISDDNDVTLLS